MIQTIEAPVRVATPVSDAVIWQARLIAEALAAGDIDESQAVLLGILYYKANWTTGVITDFRAEQLCEWTGHAANYTRTMQQRMSVLRELGWFTWTYVRGIKIPYDVTMRRANLPDTHTHRVPHTPDIFSSTTLDVKDEFFYTGGSKAGEPVTASPTRCGEHGVCVCDPRIVSELRTRIYKITGGEIIDRVLAPHQLADLLAQFSVEAICYAVDQRGQAITVQQERHRSFKSFLLNGIQIELDICEERLEMELKFQKGVYPKETKDAIIERRTRWIADHAVELRIFPALAVKAAPVVEFLRTAAAVAYDVIAVATPPKCST